VDDNLSQYLANRHWIGSTTADYNVFWSNGMSFEMYQDVILTVDLPEHGLCAGDVGTLVERHAVPGKEEGFSVEFFDMTGRTVAVVTLPSHSFRLPTPADRPSARTLSRAGV
jgi:hypothetical protein